MEVIKNLKRNIKNRSISWLLLGIIIMVITYILFKDFRDYLKCIEIDPNFIIGFLTIISLLITLIENRDLKKFNYNSNLLESIESKGMQIIGKLLTFKAKSEKLLLHLKEYKNALQENETFIDQSNLLSANDIELDLEIIVAYITSYFPEVSDDWNHLNDKLNIVANYTGNIKLNYLENLQLIKNGAQFPNHHLDKIDQYISQATIINIEIYNLTLEINKKIIEKINEIRKDVKNKHL